MSYVMLKLNNYIIQEDVCNEINKISKQFKCDHYCGLPYQGIPIATVCIQVIIFHSMYY